MPVMLPMVRMMTRSKAVQGLTLFMQVPAMTPSALAQMGNGYQARINRILATWARMVILEDMELENALRRRLSQTPPEPE
jgi:hypothetical protein